MTIRRFWAGRSPFEQADSTNQLCAHGGQSKTDLGMAVTALETRFQIL
jgi:hypothetical protein